MMFFFVLTTVAEGSRVVLDLSEIGITIMSMTFIFF